MKTEEQRLLDDAISLCRSANNIAGRSGKDTNWSAFTSALNRVLDKYSSLRLQDSLRSEFESWIVKQEFFAIADTGIVRTDSGYDDLAVHGSWLTYSAFVARPAMPAPMPVDPYLDDGVPY